MKRLGTRVLLLACTLLGGGCVSAPKQLGFDRTAQAQLRSIEVLPMRHAEIDLVIVNNPGYSFGLIGVAVAEANRAPKSRWLREQSATAKLDSLGTFTAAFESAMRERGYELAWAEPRMEPEKARTKRDMWGLRKSYLPTSHDALLDINFGFIGYASAGSSDKAPYRPTVVVTARLLSADNRKVLFEDQVIYNSVFPGRGAAITINPDEAYRYPDFDDLKAAGQTAIEGLPPAFEAVARELARQFQ